MLPGAHGPSEGSLIEREEIEEKEGEKEEEGEEEEVMERVESDTIVGTENKNKG